MSGLEQLDELATDLQNINDYVNEITKIIGDIRNELEYHADIDIPSVRERIVILLRAVDRLDEEHTKVYDGFGKLWDEATRLLPP